MLKCFEVNLDKIKNEERFNPKFFNFLKSRDKFLNQNKSLFVNLGDKKFFPIVSDGIHIGVTPINEGEIKYLYVHNLKNGIIDCISSCHYPQRNDDKERDFNHASFGVVSLETAFSVVNTVLSEENFSLKSIIELFSLNPSKIVNISLDEIKIGSKSELTIINPDENWVVDKSDIYSKSCNTPFIGRSLKGKIKYTINKNILFG